MIRSTVDMLADAGLDASWVAGAVRRALAEDLADGVDVTSVATVAADQVSTADLVCRSAGTVAGLPVAATAFDLIDTVVADGYVGTAEEWLRVAGGPAPFPVRIEPRVAEGATVGPADVLLTVTGPVRALLTAERTALNLLCHLSGVATLTRRWVDAVAGTGAAIRDTRKTTPGLRPLEKYAVRCGGGVNHRMSLADAALVKDNHVIAAGGLSAAFAAVRTAFPDVPVEVECDSLADVAEAVAAGAQLVLLDNMSTVDMARAVEFARPRQVRLEASGGLTLDRAREVAETGVDYLAVGALTHSAPALDIAMDLRATGRRDRS